MAKHNDLGVQGEEIAARWFERKGYRIIHKNWRFSKYEIDIIATKDDCLHFIEVKVRSFSNFGNPEDGVGKQKFKFLQKAADFYLLLNPQYKWIQYDILAITMHKNKEPEFFLLEDVYL